MITVKFYGLISVEHHIHQLTVKANKLKDVINEIINQCPTLSKKQLMKSIIILNKKRITGVKRFLIKLNDGDELVFLNPSSGG